MIKWKNKIISVLFAVLILVSSTGVLLIHHHCNHCGAEDWHLFSAIQCESVSHNSECCSDNEIENHEKEILENSNCCNYEDFYFKLGTFISFVEYSIAQDFNVIIDFSNNCSLFQTIPQLDNANFYTNSSPPGIKDSLYILYRSFRS